MLVDVRGVTIAVGVLLAVVALCAIDVRCSGKEREPAVLAHVKDELSAGRKEYATMKRDELAEQLRRLRAYNRRLVEKGELAESRRVTAAILELEEHYRRANEKAGR